MNKQFKGFVNRKYWLIVLPLLYLLVSNILQQQTGNYYQNSIDPEYAILYNGVLVASGNLAINFIAHPATPLIYISGISDRIVNLFTSTAPLKEDFLNSPEKYLTASITLNYILIFFTLLFVGSKIFKYSNSLALALLLQLSVFLSADLLAVGSRLIPETTMLVPLLLMMALSIKYIFQENNDIKRYLWQFSILIAFGIGCKLSFVPMLLFPLILLKASWREKGKLILYTLLFCCLFAYPLLTNFKESSSWILNMFIHSGLHGKGAENFIAITSLSSDFWQLTNHNPLFYILTLSCLFPIVLAFFTKKKSIQLEKCKKAALALLFTITVIVLFTLKHFALHYIIPFYSLMAFVLVLNFITLKQLAFFKKKQYRKPLALYFIIMALLFCYPSILKAEKWSVNTQKREKQFNENAMKIKSLMTDKNAGLIVAPSYWGSPFMAYAHCYGFMHSYRRKNFFEKELRERYPNFYCYVGWSDKFDYWDDFIDFETIFAKNNVVYLYCGQETTAMPIIQNRLQEANQNGIHFQQTILYQDKNSSEQLVKLTSF